MYDTFTPSRAIETDIIPGTIFLVCYLHNFFIKNCSVYSHEKCHLDENYCGRAVTDDCRVDLFLSSDVFCSILVDTPFVREYVT